MISPKKGYSTPLGGRNPAPVAGLNSLTHHIQCFIHAFSVVYDSGQSLGIPIEQSWMKTTFPFLGGPRAATCNPSRNLVAPSLLPAANAGCSPPSVASRVSGCLTLAVRELWCHWHIFMGLQKLYRCKCIISRINYQSDFNFQASWRKIRTRNIIFHQMIAKKISLKDLNS